MSKQTLADRLRGLLGFLVSHHGIGVDTVTEAAAALDAARADFVKIARGAAGLRVFSKGDLQAIAREALSKIEGVRS